MDGKYNSGLTVRLNTWGTWKLKRVAKRHFVNPATYARMQLMTHLQQLPDDV